MVNCVIPFSNIIPYTYYYSIHNEIIKITIITKWIMNRWILYLDIFNLETLPNMKWQWKNPTDKQTKRYSNESSNLYWSNKRGWNYAKHTHIYLHKFVRVAETTEKNYVNACVIIYILYILQKYIYQWNNYIYRYCNNKPECFE